jgi:hypothetical protein
VRLWDGKSGDLIAVFEVDGAGFSPSGDRIVTSNAVESSSHLYDARTGERLAKLGGLNPLFSPTGDRILTRLAGGRSAHLWDGRSGTLITALDARLGEEWGYVFSPAGDRIIAWAGRTATLWNGRGELIKIIEDPTSSIQNVSFSPSGDRIVTGVRRFLYSRLWDGNTGEFINTLEGNKLIFDKSGELLLTWESTGTNYGGSGVRLWEAKSGKLLRRLFPSDTIAHAQFNDAGDRVATWSWSTGTTYLWETQTAKILQQVADRDPDSFDFKFPILNSTGDRIITWRTSDGVIRIWDSITGELVSKLLRPAQPFERQLFAISAVSGGALAAVEAYGAIVDSLKNSLEYASLGPNKPPPLPPCREGYFDSDYFGFGVQKPAPQEKWRDCLQLLVAGDFLSPIFVSLMSGDLLDIRRLNRADVLEHAWETRYAKVTGQRESMHARKHQPNTMAASIISLRASVLDQSPMNWLPVLLLNGTSVQTGRRIVTSDIAIPAGVLLDAYDLHRMFESRDKFGEKTRSLSPGWDIRLSTAATMSARFPIISPHGDVYRRIDNKLLDRVVDGGYFENYGATTALELVNALKAKWKLRPFIILINNDPNAKHYPCATSPPEYAPALRRLAFTTLFAPIDAIAGTRVARGTHAASQLCDAVGKDMFAFVTVGSFFSNKELSASWWLSKYVQRTLDDALTERSINRGAFDAIRSVR